MRLQQPTSGDVDASHQPSGRKLAGILLILLIIAMWAIFVASLAPLVEHWPVIAQGAYYLILGIVWIIPLKPLVRWMQTGRWRKSGGND